MTKEETKNGARESLIGFMSNKVKSGGGINLAQGIPGFDLPVQLLDELNSLTHSDKHQYAPGNGNIKLVEQLCRHYAMHQLKAEELLITQGATEGGSLVFTYLKQQIKGTFSCLAFDPVYETYEQLPRIFGVPFHAFPLSDDLSIDFSKLEQLIKKENVRILFINSPGNPLGKVWKKEEFDKMLALSEKYKINLILDSVYRELVFDQNAKAYIPFNTNNPRLFYLNSFSKLLSITGWRIGYLICNKEHMRRIRNIHDYTGLCVPSILQEALARYLEKHDFGRVYIESLREKIRNNFTEMQSALQNSGFKIPAIEGGYFIWAKLPGNIPSGGYDFAINLYDKEKIAIVPGIHFSQKGDRYIRINIARKEEEIRNGLNKIIAYANSLNK